MNFLMNDTLLYQLAKDRQSELLREAAYQRLARASRPHTRRATWWHRHDDIALECCAA